MGCEQTIDGYLAWIRQWGEDIAEMQQYFPVICGEWCLANSIAIGYDTRGGQTVLNGVVNETETTMDEDRRKEIYHILGKAQMEAWDSWDFGRCVDFGWMEVK